MNNYILVGKKAVPCNNILEWEQQFEKTDRRVAEDKIGEIVITTVFIGRNYNYGEGEPLLFETMISGGEFEQEMDRYTTWEQAEEGHKVMVRKVKQANKEI